MEKNPRSTLFYVAVKLIDVKTKFYKDRRGPKKKKWKFFYSSERLGR